MHRLKHLAIWQKNLIVLWFGVFMVGVGMSEIMPFLPLFVEELGHFTKSEVTLYSSLVFSMCFLTMALVSPAWGRLADRKGRKLMLLRASLGMAIVFFLMGFVTNVWQLLILRALQGIFGGFVSNSNALIAVQTPKEKSGQALSILVTGSTAGTLLGPLLGGTLASVFNYRLSFHITGVILFIVFLLTLAFVKEDRTSLQSVASIKNKDLPKKTLRDILQNRLILFLFTLTLCVQVVNLAINPILSLFVKELLNGTGRVTFTAGIVAAMPGISTIIAAPFFGKLGDKYGTRLILFFGFSIAMVVFFLTGFTQTIQQLLILRFFTGISDAALLPAIQTLLTKETTTGDTSLIFSYNQSFQSIGSVLGPLAGAVIANAFGYHGIFFFCSLLMALTFTSYLTMKQRRH